MAVETWPGDATVNELSTWIAAKIGRAAADAQVSDLRTMILECFADGHVVMDKVGDLPKKHPEQVQASEVGLNLQLLALHRHFSG